MSETLLAILALVIASLSALFAGLGWLTNRRITKASEDSALHSKRSAEAAEASATESKRSADAAQTSAGAAVRSADAAEQQVQLAQATLDSGRNQRLAHQLNQARLVTMEFSNFGGLAVNIKNGGSSPIRQLSLEQVQAAEHPTYRWRPVKTVNGGQSSWAVVRPGEEVMCACEFVTPSGDVIRVPGQRYNAMYTFTDISGAEWKGNGGGPERING